MWLTRMAREVWGPPKCVRAKISTVASTVYNEDSRHVPTLSDDNYSIARTKGFCSHLLLLEQPPKIIINFYEMEGDKVIKDSSRLAHVSDHGKNMLGETAS